MMKLEGFFMIFLHSSQTNNKAKVSESNSEQLPAVLILPQIATFFILLQHTVLAETTCTLKKELVQFFKCIHKVNAFSLEELFSSLRIHFKSS